VHTLIPLDRVVISNNYIINKKKKKEKLEKLGKVALTERSHVFERLRDLTEGKLSEV
jgi:hypothetical protein